MKKKLTVYFTSDIHGYLFPTDFIAPEAVPTGLFSMNFPKDGNTLILDGGDLLQGTPLTAYCVRNGWADPLADALNEKAYDFITLGNHDCGTGVWFLAEFLGKCRAQCLCANITGEDGSLPIRPWAVKIMENGLRVGVVGLSTEYVTRWEQPKDLAGLSIRPVLQAAREAVAELKKEMPDLIIGLYHGGLEKDPETGADRNPGENIGCILCEELPFDLFLTGHQHLIIPGTSWKGIPVAQPGSNGKYYIRADWEEGSGFSTVLLAPEKPAELTSPKIALLNTISAWMDAPVGRLSRALEAEDRVKMASGGSGIADFINLVQMDASGADLSCTALANSVGGFRKEVTVRDVLTSYPYTNTLVIRQVTGRVLRQALEKSADYFDRDPDGTLRIADQYLLPTPSHFNYDFFLGMDYVLALSKPRGERVVSMKFRGREIDPEDTLTLCMNSFRSSGNFGFDFYRDCPIVKEIRTEVSDLIIDYLGKHTLTEIPDAHPIRCI